MPKTARGGERLHKRLAHLGVESRRTIEGWIAQGKIRVDGRVAQLGDKVAPHSRISVDGKPLRRSLLRHPPARARIIAYHKPEGEISARKDPANRPTVFRRLPKLKGARWVAVGRLDINTSGLLLFTNDGALANRLMHPRYNLEREYLCRVYGAVDADAMTRLRDGVKLGRETVCFARVERRRSASGGEGRNIWYSVVVHEGKYREVRRMWEAVGGRLSRLMRVRYGTVALPKNLKPGQWRELKPAAISALLAEAQAEDDVRPVAQ